MAARVLPIFLYICTSILDTFFTYVIPAGCDSSPDFLYLCSEESFKSYRLFGHEPGRVRHSARFLLSLHRKVFHVFSFVRYESGPMRIAPDFFVRFPSAFNPLSHFKADFRRMKDVDGKLYTREFRGQNTRFSASINSHGRSGFWNLY